MDSFVERTSRKGLIPILNPSKVKGTLFLLRLAPLGAYERSDIEAFLNTFTQNWIVAKEDSKKKKEHYHITIEEDMLEDDLRQKVRDFLKPFFPEQAKRGDANKQYNLQTAECEERAYNYTVKEMDITYGSNINPKYVELAIKESFQKYESKVFAEKFNAIKEEYKNTELSMGEFMEKFVQLKAIYRQPINMNYIHQVALSCRVNKEPKYAEYLVRSFLELKY